MFNKFKSLKNRDEPTIFPNLKDKDILNLNGGNDNVVIQMQPDKSHKSSANQLHNDEALLKALSNEIILQKIANVIINDHRFIQWLTISVEESILKTLEMKYDLTPTDKLKKYIEDNSNELIRINAALEDKTTKLTIVENKITEALQNIAPQVNKMLTDVAQSILHNIGTNINSEK
ncbi:MAG: hypothetical protein KBD37_00105 [Burkholderiales bacterium]|nr:hypothetical protein [Burkholderiales bacterium]